MKNKKFLLFLFFSIFTYNSLVFGYIIGEDREARRDKEITQLQDRFKWWPTDAQPAPVRDEQGGYWWWPKDPGNAKIWGNQGYIYVYKIIFDYSEDTPKEQEMRPCLVIKKIIKNIKIYFDLDKAELRDDHIPILTNAVDILKRNSEADILITGNCDIRGSEAHNLRLGKLRAKAVKDFMLNHGIPKERIKIVSRGKLDAISSIKDIVGMQKDRNAQFMIAEVEEFSAPKDKIPQADAREIEENKFIVEEEQKVESEVKVSTKEYTIKKNDTLWKIAQEQLGDGNRWKHIYEFNKDKIKNSKKLKAGQVILIPIE